MSAQVKEFRDYILYDVFEGIPNISSQGMFGGFGIYKSGFIFAIITSESELYFKVDEALKEKFQKYESRPFIYAGNKNREPVEMPYWSLPEEIMENKDLLTLWIEDSVEVSRRSKGK
ncbi:MAG: TfoX/Sxy family protein [Patescibacteria group bacterium]|nr:TfoX/Sxy family protein [Patescibacteria group bacterium]